MPLAREKIAVTFAEQFRPEASLIADISQTNQVRQKIKLYLESREHHLSENITHYDQNRIFSAVQFGPPWTAQLVADAVITVLFRKYFAPFG